MTVLANWYNRATLYIGNGTYQSTGAIGSASLSIASQSYKVALLTSSYTFSAAHAVYGDLTNELTTANGYTAGGLALGTLAFTQATTVTNFTAANASWASSGTGIPAWRHAVIYVNATVGGIVKPLLIDFDNNGSDVALTPSGSNLVIAWNATGIFQVAHS